MNAKKLVLNRETVRELSSKETPGVGGGGVIRPLHTIIPFPCLTRHATCDDDLYEAVPEAVALEEL